MTSERSIAGMLIRRPIDEVFNAFVDPTITSRFWFTQGSGPLVERQTAVWTWAMYGFHTDVAVRKLERPNHISVDWLLPDEPAGITWKFAERSSATFVEVLFAADASTDKSFARALDFTDGFALVLAGAKIWLEHGIEPRFVLDRHPDARVTGWQ